MPFFCSPSVLTSPEKGNRSIRRFPISQLSLKVITGSTAQFFIACDFPVVGGPMTMTYKLHGKHGPSLEIKEF